MPINLQTCVSRIILNNPELAEPLLDVLVFMADKGAVLSPDYDEACEMAYAKTADSSRHRELYQKARAA